MRLATARPGPHGWAVIPRRYTSDGLSIAPVLGPFQGWTAERPDNLLYDEDLWLKEDYDMSLKVLLRYHRIWRMCAYHYMVDHFNEAGGVVGTRNMEEEVRQLHALQRRWGSDVVRIRLRRCYRRVATEDSHRAVASNEGVNPLIKVPLSGI